MRDGDRGQLAWGLHQNALGVSTPGECSAMLMAVREATPRDSMLRDLCDCVAHELRDRPRTYAHRYALRVIKRLKRMADVDTPVLVEGFFPIGVVIDQVLQIARYEGIAFDEAGIRANADHLADQIGMALSGTVFRIAGAEVVTRFESPGGSRIEVSLLETYVGKQMSIPSNVTISLPMLSVGRHPGVSPAGWEGMTAAERGLATFLRRPRPAPESHQ